MRIQTSALLVAASLVGGVAPVHAQDVKTVSVVAEAPFSGDLVATEKEAKREARRKAIEEGVGVTVSSNSLVRNFELVSDEITSEAKGIIQDEKWGALMDGPTSSTKKISLTAKVSRDIADLEKAACTIVKANHDPKVALVIVEKIGDAEKWTTERGLFEAMFAEAFMNSCFTLVESGVKVTEVSANGDLPQETINEIVKNADAQYVILGQARAVRSDSGIVRDGPMNSYNVSASMKLVNTSNNGIEAVASKQVQVLGISPQVAINVKGNATKKVAFVNGITDELVEKIATRWSSDAVNASKVQVQVQGANYSAAKSFREFVEQGLKARVESRKVLGGVASFDIEVEGGADTLAAYVEGKKAGKYTIEVVEVSRGKVVLKLN